MSDEMFDECHDYDDCRDCPYYFGCAIPIDDDGLPLDADSEARADKRIAAMYDEEEQLS